MEETTKQFLTTIAENQPKIKELGYNEGFSAGKQAEHNRFWDACFANSTTTYKFAGTCWNKDNFKPDRDFIIGDLTFYRHGWLQPNAYDLANHLEELGVKIMYATNGTQIFQYATIFTRLPEIDLSRATKIDRTFDGMTNLITFDKLIIDCDKITNFGLPPFQNCTSLKNIVVEGVLGGFPVNFSWCPLTVASMKSIISCLKDYRGTESEFTYTITFSSACITTLEAEGATSPNGNTWTEYIDDLKWNLTLA